jgi:hypothetical protein
MGVSHRRHTACRGSANGSKKRLLSSVAFQKQRGFATIVAVKSHYRIPGVEAGTIRSERRWR